MSTTFGRVETKSSRAWAPLPAWPTTMSSSVSRSETRESRNPVLSSTTSTRTRWRVVAGALCTNMSPVSRSRSPGASAIRAFHRLPQMGDNVRRRRAISAPDFASLPACGDPAAMLATDLLAERSFPCGARARSTSSRRRANRRPPGPGTPESRERGNASAGEGRIGCAMTRATQCAAVPTDCDRARTTSTAAAPHVGATPHVLPHVRSMSRSLAPSERSSPDEPRWPRRGRQCRDNQRRPTVARRIAPRGRNGPRERWFRRPFGDHAGHPRRHRSPETPSQSRRPRTIEERRRCRFARIGRFRWSR